MTLWRRSQRRGACASALALAMGLCMACGGGEGDGSADGATSAAGLHFTTPTGWIEEAPANSMRKAQYRLPRADNDSANASLVLYFFGGAAGGTEANIQRWLGQMSAPDGGTVTPRTDTLTVGGMKITTVDVSGTYSGGGTAMGGPAAPAKGYRLVASVIESPGGNYFFKLTGPERTVARWLDGYRQMLQSLRYGG